MLPHANYVAQEFGHTMRSCEVGVHVGTHIVCLVCETGEVGDCCFWEGVIGSNNGPIIVVVVAVGRSSSMVLLWRRRSRWWESFK